VKLQNGNDKDYFLSEKAGCWASTQINWPTIQPKTAQQVAIYTITLPF